MGFVAFSSGILSKAGLPWPVFIAGGLLTGIVLAGLNGWISVTFKVPSIVVTLAMNMVHLGAYATFLPNSGWVENLGNNFIALGRGRFFDIVPYIFVISLVVATLCIFLMRYTRFGKSLYAVGATDRLRSMWG